jgi:phenylpyruvate tautomerase PptA (4-oxalocrotonate tautomerase family)
MDLFYPAGALAPDARARLGDELTTVLLRAERAPETQFFRDVTWLHVHELPAGAVMAAGRPVEQPTFRVEVSVPEGALSARRKQEFVAEATRAIREAAGIAEADGLRIWVLIRDVPDGNWGAGGQVVEFAKLREIAREQAAAAGAAAS